jgi:uncharacterized protein YjdB
MKPKITKITGASLLAVLMLYLVGCPTEPEPEPVAVTGVSLNKTALTLEEGRTETLAVSVLPEDAANKNLNWSSSAPDVAAVSEAGLVSAVAAGTATITVTSVDGGYTANCTVTVGPVSVTGVSLNRTTLSLFVGGMETLTATIAPVNAANQAVSWSSSAPAVASVSEAGLVRGTAAGTATITVTATDGGYTANCTVTVSPVPVTGIILDRTTLSPLYIGDTETLVATIAPANATTQGVSWSSSAPAVATVSETGLVSGVAAGTATITVTASDGGYTANCTVKVKSGPRIPGA